MTLGITSKSGVLIGGGDLTQTSANSQVLGHCVRIADRTEHWRYIIHI